MKSRQRISALIIATVLVISILTGCSYSIEYSSDYYIPMVGEEDLIQVDDSGKQPDETPENSTSGTAVGSYPEEMEVSSTAEATTTTVTATESATTTADTTAAATTPPITTVITSAAIVIAPVEGGPATVDGIGNETFLTYDSICQKYRPAGDQKCYLYNFNTSLSMGFGADGSVLPTEADYGIRGWLDGKMITCILYDHTRKKALRNIYLQALDESAYNEAADIQTVAAFAIDGSTFANGLYRVGADFSDGRQLALYFYVNGSEIWLCEQKSMAISTESNYAARRKDLNTVLQNGNVTPENSLSLEKLYYPFKATADGIRCDTQLWIDLSNTIIDDSWSDEYKLYVIQAWVRENIAYDTYISNELSHSRAQFYRDLSGAQSVYDLRAGVCFDYVNIIAILCRAHGIPTVTIGSESMNHVWNVVYVNNRWMEYDACLSDQYSVGEDTTVRTKTGEPLYDGIYSPIVVNNETGKMPSDALANQYLQWDTNYLY